MDTVSYVSWAWTPCATWEATCTPREAILSRILESRTCTNNTLYTAGPYRQISSHKQTRNTRATSLSQVGVYLMSHAQSSLVMVNLLCSGNLTCNPRPYAEEQSSRSMAPANLVCFVFQLCFSPYFFLYQVELPTLPPSPISESSSCFN